MLARTTQDFNWEHINHKEWIIKLNIIQVWTKFLDFIMQNPFCTQRLKLPYG